MICGQLQLVVRFAVDDQHSGGPTAAAITKQWSHNADRYLGNELLEVIVGRLRFGNQRKMPGNPAVP